MLGLIYMHKFDIIVFIIDYTVSTQCLLTYSAVSTQYRHFLYQLFSKINHTIERTAFQVFKALQVLHSIFQRHLHS